MASVDKSLHIVTIATLLLLGVVWGVSCEDDQSDSANDDQPIEEIGKRRNDAPEVVLQLKYRSGELNRIYLAQFRKEKESTTAAVLERTDLCADLCHAGLGGEACGATCLDLLPVGLQTALKDSNHSQAESYGVPRVEVCPTLCDNNLGYPLCNCASTTNYGKLIDWNGICTAFCNVDKYELGGCPSCEDTSVSTHAPVQILTSRILDTVDGWTAWCDVQCRQGQGGAACNCDRAPF